MKNIVDWNVPQVRIALYLIYGTSFILMWIVIMFWREKVTHIELMKNFIYLAVFGLLHGLAEYSDIPRFLAWQPSWVYDSIKLIFVSSSFTILFVFGLNIITVGMEQSKRWIRGIPFGSLIMYFWLLFFIGIDFKNNGIGINYKMAEIAIRYSIGFFGAAVSGYAFLNLSEKMKTIVGEEAGERLFIAGMLFVLYAIFGGLIQEELLGIPVVVFRSIISILITISIIHIFQLFKMI